jgi:hypothetical protein
MKKGYKKPYRKVHSRATKASKVLAVPRGGFRKESPTWSFARKLAVKAAQGAIATRTAEGLNNFIDKMDLPKEIQAKVGKLHKTAMKAPSPTQNYEGTEEIPVTSVTDVVRKSGGNGTYSAKIHRIHFSAGKRPSKALLALGKMQGITKMRIYDTQRQMLADNTRPDLSFSHGFNRRIISQVMPTVFGFNVQDLAWRFGLQQGSGYGTSPTKNQTSYGAVYKLTSQLNAINNNKILPCKLKLHFVRQKSLSLGSEDIMPTVANDTIITQQPGKIPVVRQLTAGTTTNPVRHSIAVDNTSHGFFSCGNGKQNFERIKTFNVNLAAGDSLQLTYDHWLRSGIHLQKLHSAVATTEVDYDSYYTYALIIEHYGPQVEAISATDANVRYRGTAWGQFNIETKKFLEGVMPSAGTIASVNPASALGFASNDFAIRSFTTVDASSGLIADRRVFNTGFEDASLSIPIITDTSVVASGRKDIV